jgi:hypothetical protein
MRIGAIVVLCSWLGASVPARAQEVRPRVLNRDARTALGLGVATFAVGLGLGLAHFANANTPQRFYDLVPVAGPPVVMLTTENSAGWGVVLFLSAWLEAVGAVTAAVSASRLYEPPSEKKPGFEFGGSNRGLTLKARF